MGKSSSWPLDSDYSSCSDQKRATLRAQHLQRFVKRSGSSVPSSVFVMRPARRVANSACDKEVGRATTWPWTRKRFLNGWSSLWAQLSSFAWLSIRPPSIWSGLTIPKKRFRAFDCQLQWHPANNSCVQCVRKSAKRDHDFHRKRSANPDSRRGTSRMMVMLALKVIRALREQYKLRHFFGVKQDWLHWAQRA